MSARGLTVVATPIGNLGDLSPRASETLASVDLILAEDTRRTGRLLAHLDVDTPQRSFHEHNEAERIPEVLDRLRRGEAVALVTDAGTPGVSDPGYRLVRACLDADLAVDAVPGPSAVLQALVLSGLPTGRFVFEGFLPRKGRTRRARLEALTVEPRTAVLFLAPHRTSTDLDDLAEVAGGDREAALCRELTKLHQEVRRSTLAGLAAETGEPRGEVTLVLAGVASAPPTSQLAPRDLAALVAVRVGAGTAKKDAVAEVAGLTGAPKRVVYQAVLDHGAEYLPGPPAPPGASEGDW